MLPSVWAIHVPHQESSAKSQFLLDPLYRLRNRVKRFEFVSDIMRKYSIAGCQQERHHWVRDLVTLGGSRQISIVCVGSSSSSFFQVLTQLHEQNWRDESKCINTMDLPGKSAANSRSQSPHWFWVDFYFFFVFRVVALVIHQGNHLSAIFLKVNPRLQSKSARWGRVGVQLWMWSAICGSPNWYEGGGCQLPTFFACVKKKRATPVVKRVMWTAFTGADFTKS